MRPWPTCPVIYEISTWAWLADLSRAARMVVDLGTVPATEWDAIAACGFDAVWFMGVWERSPAGIAISMQHPGLLADFRRALPDFAASDNAGSPYCIRRYVVDPRLGGAQGLAKARVELATRGLDVILDFVPNHVAPDHPWATDHPEYFIRGTTDDLRDDPASFLGVGGSVFACGRDPHHPAWPDVLQLNAFSPGLREVATETLADIASQCDGVRCDMAMLMLNDIFARTWGPRAGERPSLDYWATVIPAITAAHPGFRFIAEAYWDLEWVLLQQGFDHCYDKTLYDRLEHGPVEEVRQHLLADIPYQQGMVRFIENHDEPRAAAAFPGDKGRAAAVTILTLPGARLLHEGQFDGRTVRLPVFLGRRPTEMPDLDLAAFYARLLEATTGDLFRNGDWCLCGRSGWPDNQSCQQILAWGWLLGAEKALIVVNYGPQAAQALIHVPWDELRGRQWRLDDALTGHVYDRHGTDMREAGLYVDLAPWQSHLFRIHPASPEA
jgi:hypothetical protein